MSEMKTLEMVVMMIRMIKWKGTETRRCPKSRLRKWCLLGHLRHEGLKGPFHTELFFPLVLTEVLESSGHLKRGFGIPGQRPAAELSHSHSNRTKKARILKRCRLPQIWLSLHRAREGARSPHARKTLGLYCGKIR